MTEDYVYLTNITLYAHWNMALYQVILQVLDPEYGSLSPSHIENQPCGTLYSLNSNNLIVGNDPIAPTPAEPSDGCTYEFTGWFIGDDEVTTGIILSSITFTAHFVKYCEVSLTVSENGYGSLDPDMIGDKLEGTAYSANGNILEIGSDTVTATPAEPSDGCTYEFTGWFIGDDEVTSGTVSSAVTFTARFV